MLVTATQLLVPIQGPDQMLPWGAYGPDTLLTPAIAQVAVNWILNV